MNYRFKEDISIIEFPPGFEEEDRLKCKRYCCTPELRLASLTEDGISKNDVTGVFIKRSDLTDVVTFKIEKCGAGNLTPLLGYAPTFPQDTLAIGYVFDWKQYLQTYGIGRYTIKVEYTISGITQEVTWGQYDLKEYSIYSARGTVQVYSEWRSKYQLFNIDFSNSDFKDSIRFKGFFGNREPKTQINNLISKGRKVEKVTREHLNTYTLKTDPVANNITRQLVDWHLLNEDKMLITDHNATNHFYYFEKAVVLEDEPEIEYYEKNRWAKITAKVGDRDKLDKTYYNEKL